jgi:putative flippase GtrA
MLATGRQAGSFAVIGGIGFVVDGGILTILNSVYDVALLSARLVSFSAAVTTTWYLNRRRTFADRKNEKVVSEWGRYAAVNSIGSILNMGIFFWLIAQNDALARMPLIPLGIAASVALVFNFIASKYVVFGASSHE